MRRFLLALAFLPFTCFAQSAVVGNQGIVGNGVLYGGGGAAPATYVSSTACNMASTVASCTNGSLSISSGNIIVVGLTATGAPGNTITASDSNSDSPSCNTAVEENTDAFSVRICIMKAGASVTSVTCTQGTPTGNTAGCVVAWYTPGSLTGAIDQSTGQDQPNTTNWSSGNTATLSGSNDLVVDYWAMGSNSVTSTYSDGSTQRINNSAGAASNALSDRNVSGTTAVAASGTWTPAPNYGACMVMAIK